MAEECDGILKNKPALNSSLWLCIKQWITHLKGQSSSKGPFGPNERRGKTVSREEKFHQWIKRTLLALWDGITFLYFKFHNWCISTNPTETALWWLMMYECCIKMYKALDYVISKGKECLLLLGLSTNILVEVAHNFWSSDVFPGYELVLLIQYEKWHSVGADLHSWL